MQNIYIATIYVAAIVCFLTSLLLFARRRDGERSRMLLACIVLFSVVNYATRFVDLSQDEVPDLVISVRMLLLGIFMVTSYIMYPIEVISPGYLNPKRIVKIYIPWLVLVVICLLLEWLGIDFKPYGSISKMLPYATKFEVWFRLVLVLLIFTPVIAIFFIPYTRRYNNAGKSWMRKYITFFTINSIAYILVLTFDSIIVKTLYYYVSVGCSLGIVYMELFVRLIREKGPNKELNEHVNSLSIINSVSYTEESLDNYSKQQETQNLNHSLGDKLQLYIERTRAYNDPDISINTLASALNTNRTTLGSTIKSLGYESFTAYINALRIRDFIEHVKNGNSESFQNTFYNVGFRSRATAIRNFRQATGMTPSEYFQRQRIIKEN